MNSSSPSQDKDTQRSCTDCRTTTTPLWRSGPAGPRLGLMAIQRGITAFEESMLKEEEQAAIMLMALSSESFHIFA
ncbi:hypothetical protein FEM48_Zijuj09G0016400 [Ziziphus jujuba var. spinosa]|uniref:GATA-type domain-containing protein n=1 Tax=Ziziphus jujuba var. spinosa TaxID=714518 RepID=A0A978UQ58_ZIZJJ|nr:hypothetical protein FEM48_Zijuj09G0016400 [Ziziphus jujuba var. spinosa]